MYNAVPRHGTKSFSIHLVSGKTANEVLFFIEPLKKWPEDKPHAEQ
jgi:hypothetical protein